MSHFQRAIYLDMIEAERKAIDSLARYKFVMFGYWCGVWVHLNRLSGVARPSPFAVFVKLAKKIREENAPPVGTMGPDPDLVGQTMPAAMRANEGFIPRFVGDFPGNPKGREQTQADDFKWARENGYQP